MPSAIMKIIFSCLVLVMLTVSCSPRTKEAVYNMMHDLERQECLKQGNKDCSRGESYQQYKKVRQEITPSSNNN